MAALEGLRLMAPIHQVWRLSMMLFALCMFLTFFAWTVKIATVILAFIGMSWAIATWAPFALIGVELAQLRNSFEDTEYVGSTGTTSSREKAWLQGKDQSAAVMALHNVAICIPQIAAALGCAVLFKALELMNVENRVVWAFRAGGIAMACAAWRAHGQVA